MLRLSIPKGRVRLRRSWSRERWLARGRYEAITLYNDPGTFASLAPFHAQQEWVECRFSDNAGHCWLARALP